MYLAIDLGGTGIKLAFFENNTQEPAWKAQIPAYSDRGIVQGLDRVKETLQKSGIKNFKQVGIAIPGIVDSAKCRLLSVNGKYMDAVGFPFPEWIRLKFGCPLVMENDANAALLGEISFGCGQGCDNAVMMILGTGVGTAACMEGRILHGAHQQAGIMGGHFVICSGGKTCSCKGAGCLEAYVGAREVQKALGRMDLSESVLKDWPNPGIKEVAKAWKEGDALATYIMQKQIQLYSDGIVNLILAYDPEMVILSGGHYEGRRKAGNGN